MNEYTRFKVDHIGQVAHVQFTRTDKLNAMDALTWIELRAVFDHLSDSGTVRAAVISSEGKHFCTGMDLSVFLEGGTDISTMERGRGGEHFGNLVRDLQASISSIEKARFPVIAAIQGGCLGAGFDLIAACDIRLAQDDAWFQITETEIGMTADVGTLQRILGIMPSGLARQLVYTADKLNAERALSCGLVNELFDSKTALINSALDIAKRISGHSPMSVYGAKHILNYSRDHAVDESLAYQVTWQGAQFHTEDMKEALTARFEKRVPEYPDLPARETLFSKK